MAVVIRLRRMGSNKRMRFRVVATDSRRSNQGRFLEVLGWYDPKQSGKNYELNSERVDYWLQQGAQMSETVGSLVRKARKSAGSKTPAAPKQVAPSAPAAAAEDAASCRA